MRDRELIEYALRITREERERKERERKIMLDELLRVIGGRPINILPSNKKP